MRKPKTWQAWPDADIERLKRLVAEGVTHREITKLMGRSLDAIRSQCRQHKIKKPPSPDTWPELQMDFLIAHYGKPGWTFQRIADALPGEPRRTMLGVKDKAVRLGLSTGNSRGHTQRLPEIYVKRCLILAMQDLSTYDIASRLGASHSWVLKTIDASPYHAKRYRARVSIRRSNAQENRRRSA